MTDKIHFLKIESYSEHPEVTKAAELLVEAYMSTMQRRRDAERYIRDAKKLVASLWLKGDKDLFRFTTRAEYFSSSKRKQVWMTSRTLKLFKQMRKLGWVRTVKGAIPPQVSKKTTGGMTAIYCRTKTFKDLLKTLTVMDIAPNPDMPRVELRDEDEVLIELPEAYLKSGSYRETVAILENHYQLLEDSDIRYLDNTKIPLGLLYFVRKFRPDFEHGGRIYAGFQNLPKQVRLGITMEGESVASLDISQLHPALILRLTHRADSEQPGMLQDALPEVYTMPDYPDLPRTVHKKLISTMINASSEDSAARSLMNHYYWWDIINDEWVVKGYKGKQKREGEKVFSGNKPLKQAEKYLETFKLRHPMMADAV
ncbi:MAG: hypothetical protein P8M72_02855, partial [Gammaproteobacteria bacterium]|nr:hypothetical protein [Gammaproteobacteria bacterium]